MLNDLVKASQQGDENATLALVDHFKPTMLKHATNLVKYNVISNTVEDYYSELLVKFLQALQKVNANESELSVAKYLHTALVNKTVQIQNKLIKTHTINRRDLVASLDKLIPSTTRVGESAPLVNFISDKRPNEFSYEIEDFLKRNLSKKNYEVMKLHVIGNFSYKEIADILHLEYATVLGRKHNAAYCMRKRANVLLK